MIINDLFESAAPGPSLEQLATISDQALDDAYHYGRSSPGNTFGWQANLKSAAYAKLMIDAGETDIDRIADAIHQGWNVTARAFVANPDQFDDTAKLRAAGKLEAKLEQRAKLMKIGYAQLPDEEQEKDRVVARALLQALKGKPGVAEGLEEAVGGNYLYHARSAYDAKDILASGYIPQAIGPQIATQAQTQLPTVSVTRDWGYASGAHAQSQMAGIGRDVVFVLDRNAVESNFKTLGTSQSTDIRGQAFNPYFKKDGQARSQNTDQGARTNAKNKAKYAEPTAKAGGEFEEAVVVPKGALPLKGTMVGFWVNPKSELINDPTIMNDPRRLDMVRPNQFAKAKQEQGVAEGIDNTNQFGVDFNNIKRGDKIITEPDSYTGRRSSFIVLSKARFPNGMLALKVKDKSQDKGYSLVNFLEVEKVRKQGVAEAEDPKFSKFMARALAKAEDPKFLKFMARTLANRVDKTPVKTGLDFGEASHKPALYFGIKTLQKLKPAQRAELSAKGEFGVIKWLTAQATKAGLAPGKFKREDLAAVQDFLPEVFKDPAITSWALVLTDGAPLTVPGPFQVWINKSGSLMSDWVQTDSLDTQADAEQIFARLVAENPTSYIRITDGNGTYVKFYSPHAKKSAVKEAKSWQRVRNPQVIDRDYWMSLSPQEQNSLKLQHRTNGIRLKTATKPKPPAKPRREKIDYAEIARKIEDVVGNTFPDGDPLDWLIPYMRRRWGMEDNIGKHLDRAARQHLDSRGYYEFLERMWDQVADDENLGDRVTRANNPWRTNEGVEEAKHFQTAYGWAGGKKPNGGKYKHPEQIKQDREAKKKAQDQSKAKEFSEPNNEVEEGQDACYHKVRSRYKVWPSAYASGALVQCRKKGAANWGTGGKKK